MAAELTQCQGESGQSDLIASVQLDNSTIAVSSPDQTQSPIDSITIMKSLAENSAGEENVTANHDAESDISPRDDVHENGLRACISCDNEMVEEHLNTHSDTGDGSGGLTTRESERLRGTKDSSDQSMSSGLLDEELVCAGSDESSAGDPVGDFYDKYGQSETSDDEFELASCTPCDNYRDVPSRPNTAECESGDVDCPAHVDDVKGAVAKLLEKSALNVEKVELEDERTTLTLTT